MHKNKKIILLIAIIMLSVAASMNNDSTPSIEEVMDYVQSQLLQEINPRQIKVLIYKN